MIRINFDIDYNTHYKFQKIVGKGNVSRELKKYMEYFVSSKDNNTCNIYQLQNKLNIINNKIKESNEELKKIKLISEDLELEKRNITIQIDSLDLEKQKKLELLKTEEEQQIKQSEILRKNEERESLLAELRRL